MGPNTNRIWSGTLEWYEKNTNSFEKQTFQIPCEISPTTTDGELKA